MWTLTLTKTALYWTAYSSCFLDGYPSQDQGVKSLTYDWSIVTNPAFSLVENRTFIHFGYCTFLPLYHHHNPFVTVPIFTLICLSSSSATLSVNYQWRKFPKSSLSVYCKLNVLNSFKTKILIRLKIFVEIFFGPKIFLDQHFLKHFQAEHFRLESCCFSG